MHCAQTRTLAQRKLKLVQGKILDLYSIEQALKKLIRACNAGTRSRGQGTFDDSPSVRQNHLLPPELSGPFHN